MKRNYGGLLKGMPVALMMGGPGKEREVTLRSGAAVAGALRKCGASVSEMDVAGPGFQLPEGTRLVYNMIHGTFGEDGGLQALLDGLGVAYTGEGAEGSRLAFDKIETKARFDRAGVPTCAWKIFGRGENPEWPVPCVIKAPRQGSSVGVHIVRSRDEIPAALDDCFQYGGQVLVEEFFTGRELTVGILGDQALPIVEIVPHEGFYDYEHKYTKGASEYHVPANLEPAVTANVQAAALDKFFFSNPDYTLKHVTLELDSVMTREEALAETGIREGDNIFRVDLANAEKALRAVPQVGDVCIERRLPDHISITVTARHPVAWVAPIEKDADPFDPEKSLLVDDAGFLMKPRIIQPEFYHLPVIYGVQSDNIRDGEPLHNEDLHRALALLDEVARHPECLLNIRSMNISKGYCVEVVSDRKARVTFSTEDYSEQLGRLRQLLEHCRDTGRELDSVNLMVRRNTPVTGVMAQPAAEKMPTPSQRTAQTAGGRKR